MGRSPVFALVLILPVLAVGDTDHWSLRPIVRPELPESTRGDWDLPLDRFVLARLEAAGLQPSPAADRATLIRRMSLVLCGLPPEPDDVEAFVQDTQPDAYEALIGRLLDSPNYGERWARHWLDVARFAETNGFETNTPRPNAWRYRDYVIRAFNEDLPFDRFVAEQVAGDVMGVDAATGFLVGGAYDTVLSPDVGLTLQQRQDELADMVNTTSTAFLGLTVACARCHDHKFDPITQTDYYAMQAIFAGVRHGERPLRTAHEAERLARVEDQRLAITALRAELDALPDASASGSARSALVIDDEATEHVTVLRTLTGYGTNPAGDGRGRQGDRGDPQRLPNISGGRYSWWNDVTDEDVIAYRPGVVGRHRLWLSWGAGWDTHATDAAYFLDVDGNLDTTEDRKLLATVDQQTFANGPHGPPHGPPNEPLWSGLLDVGVHDLAASDQIVLRAGSAGRPVTADVIVLEAAEPDSEAECALPRLRPGVSALVNEELITPILAHRLRFRVFSTNSEREPCLDELEVYAGDVNVALSATHTTSGNYAGDPKHLQVHLNDGLYGNAHSWISDTLGTGWVEFEFAEPARIDRVVWGRDREGVFADRLATDYVIEIAAPSGEWRVVASSRDRLPPGLAPRDVPAYRFAGLAPEIAARADRLLAGIRTLESSVAELERLPRVYAGRFEQPASTHLLHRGDPLAVREVVAPDVPAVFGSLGLDSLGLDVDAPEHERRLALAGWLCAPENPLTARVIVNRIWMHHFGEGLVDTPSDFGVMGTEPSHSALLDWLAAELVESGWSLKHIQRLIVSSRTWRQASHPNAAGLAKDEASRLLWRFPPRRMEAEYLRDAILAVAGTLLERGGGPGFSVFEPDDNYVRVYTPSQELDPDTWRRMIYMTKVRMERGAVFGMFDTPDAGQVCPKRARSTTALQALNLLNSPFVMQQAREFAARLERESVDDRDLQVRRAFQLAFGREPEPQESAGALALYAEHGLPALCRALFNANEFAFVH